MFPFQKNKEIVVEVVLRFAVGSVLLWFGLDKWLHPEVWMGWLPRWSSAISSAISAEWLVYVIGGVEVTVGIVLCAGRLLRPASIIASLLFAVGSLSGGVNDDSIRDLALAGACLALFAHENRRLGLKRRVSEELLSIVWRGYVLLLLMVGILFLRNI